MSVEDNKLRYLIQDSDRTGGSTDALPYYPEVSTYENSTVTPMVDGKQYLADLEFTIDAMSGSDQGIFVAGWMFDDIYQIALPSGRILFDVLQEKAAAGVDVRILVWLNDFIASANHSFFFVTKDLSKQESHMMWPRDVLEMNVDLFFNIRTGGMFPDLEERVIANTIDKNLGASHMKFILVFDSTRAACYTGGIDLERLRNSDSFHGDADNMWHDIQAKVEGDAVQAMYDYFKYIWDEHINIREYDTGSVATFKYKGETISGTPLTADRIASRTMPIGFNRPTSSSASYDQYSSSYSTSTGLHCVQSLRTVPKKPGAKAISFATEGIYEIQLAVKKIIGAAQKYIYIEDQDFWSRDILGYIKEAVQANADLKVVLVTGQNDPTVNENPTTKIALQQYLLEDLTDSQKGQVVFYHHQSAVIHAKLYIVDDLVAIIGSAGIYNRALFTEIEHSVMFIDNSDSQNTVREFRMRLWAEHFGINETEREELADIDTALAAWNPEWGTGPSFLPPQFAETYAQLTKNRVDGLAGCFFYFTLFLRDADGFDTEDTSVGTWSPISSTIYFSDGGTDFFEDLTLVTPEEYDLTGLWIVVLSGPNEGVIRRITGHEGQRITFDPMESDNDETTSLLFVYARIVMDDFNEYDTAALNAYAIVLKPWMKHFQDLGDLP